MGKIVECRDCGEVRKHHARGLCDKCYTSYHVRLTGKTHCSKPITCMMCQKTSTTPHQLIDEEMICKNCIRKHYPQLAESYNKSSRESHRRHKKDNVNIEWLTRMLSG